MIVPRYWAEGRAQGRKGEHQVTLRRFGWSNLSEADAQRLADERVGEALTRLRAGEKGLRRREPKVAYNGAEGVPIREEIVSEHGDAVVTRNLYGARCLNTPDVLFADVDFDDTCLTPVNILVVALLLVCAGWSGERLHSWQLGVGVAITALFVSPRLVRGIRRAATLFLGSPVQRTRRRLGRFIRKHAEWRVAVYETPAGLRLLALHRPIQPNDPEALAFFRAVHADPAYVRMCLRQQCFRARLSAKPWRIGISQHIKPRPGVWPIRPERRPERQRWIDAYEKAAENFAACRHVETLGGGGLDPKAATVQSVHDELTRARTALPLA